MARTLTAKQQKFVEVYAGNGTEAARLAGYKGSDAVLAQVASENLRKPEISEAIFARQKRATAGHVASREKRQAFWTEIMENEKMDLGARLRASELLGKSQADFTLKLKHEGGVSVAVVDPYAEPKK